MINADLIARLTAMRDEMTEILAALTRDDAAARIDAAQNAVPETHIGG